MRLLPSVKGWSLTLPGIVDQGLVAQGPSQQIEGLARLAQAALGEPAFLHRVAAHQVVAERARGPLAEAYAPPRVDPVADRDDGVEVVVFQAAPNPPPAIGPNC